MNEDTVINIYELYPAYGYKKAHSLYNAWADMKGLPKVSRGEFRQVAYKLGLLKPRTRPETNDLSLATLLRNEFGGFRGQYSEKRANGIRRIKFYAVMCEEATLLKNWPRIDEVARSYYQRQNPGKRVILQPKIDRGNLFSIVILVV